jgi:hypothetical protein
LENFDRLPEALAALYGFDKAGVEVRTTNTAQEKPYAAHYHAVKDAFCLSEHDLAAVYDLPYVRHFYTPMEINAFKSCWRATGQPSVARQL